MIKAFLHIRHWLTSININPDKVSVYIMFENAVDREKSLRQLAEDSHQPPSSLATDYLGQH